jgi:GntR family transcriptional repressor for pyruvate dehydrogenase complex
MALTDEAISRIRTLIQSGQLPPGARLPPEHQLATEMGISRSGIREAVKVLAAARVLEVRRGDGTYVTSLEPALLLEGVGFAIELLQGETLLEVMEVRRLLEPAATALAAHRATDRQLDELGELVRGMRGAAADAEDLMRCDLAFHRTVIAATGNETLASLLDGLSGRTVRARVWRGLVLGNVAQKTIEEHEAIHLALTERNQSLAHAVALIHVTTSELWLRTVMNRPPGQEPAR